MACGDKGISDSIGGLDFKGVQDFSVVTEVGHDDEILILRAGAVRGSIDSGEKGDRRSGHRG